MTEKMSCVCKYSHTSDLAVNFMESLLYLVSYSVCVLKLITHALWLMNPGDYFASVVHIQVSKFTEVMQTVQPLSTITSCGLSCMAPITYQFECLNPLWDTNYCRNWGSG